jgi:hypothetical protein
MDEVKGHSIGGIDIVCSLTRSDRFLQLKEMIPSHHVKYGPFPGYPVQLPGNKIALILPALAPLLGRLDPNQKKLFCKTVLSPSLQRLARIFNIIDQIQALTATDRSYRTRMPLDKLYGYLRRQAGIDFDPQEVNFILGLFRAGLFDNLFSHYENAHEEFQEYLPIEIYKWDDIIQFFQSRKEVLQMTLKIDVDDFIERFLQAGEGKGLSMSPQCLGWNICEFYIRQYRQADRGLLDYNLFMKGAYNDAVAQYKKDRVAFSALFDKYFHPITT